MFVESNVIPSDFFYQEMNELNFSQNFYTNLSNKEELDLKKNIFVKNLLKEKPELLPIFSKFIDEDHLNTISKEIINQDMMTGNNYFQNSFFSNNISKYLKDLDIFLDEFFHKDFKDIKIPTILDNSNFLKTHEFQEIMIKKILERNKVLYEIYDLYECETVSSEFIVLTLRKNIEELQMQIFDYLNESNKKNFLRLSQIKIFINELCFLTNDIIEFKEKIGLITNENSDNFFNKIFILCNKINGMHDDIRNVEQLLFIFRYMKEALYSKILTNFIDISYIEQNLIKDYLSNKKLNFDDLAFNLIKVTLLKELSVKDFHFIFDVLMLKDDQFIKNLLINKTEFFDEQFKELEIFIYYLKYVFNYKSSNKVILEKDKTKFFDIQKDFFLLQKDFFRHLDNHLDEYSNSLNALIIDNFSAITKKNHSEINAILKKIALDYKIALKPKHKID